MSQRRTGEQRGGDQRHNAMHDPNSPEQRDDTTALSNYRPGRVLSTNARRLTQNPLAHRCGHSSWIVLLAELGEVLTQIGG